jgi:hypothetical protein
VDVIYGKSSEITTGKEETGKHGSDEKAWQGNKQLRPKRGGIENEHWAAWNAMASARRTARGLNKRDNQVRSKVMHPINRCPSGGYRQH